MALHRSELPADILAAIKRGMVIPAHPLVLTAERKMDERRQRALTRYYVDAGAGGLAVGVHTGQYANRAAGLYEPLLARTAETARAWTDRPVMLLAGLTGPTEQALGEARLAVSLGYHVGMVNVGDLKGQSEDAILDHCRKVAEVIPTFGFYLLPEVGGMKLSSDFWRRFCGIDNVVGIKIAPFNRYGTVDVVRGVVEARAEDRVALYTGNDDHIVLDLLTPFQFKRDGGTVTVHMVGGLLGHWSFWVHSAVRTLGRIHQAIATGRVDMDLLALDAKTTDANGAIYDGANDLVGYIPGCHEVLRRQGLLEGIWCLNPDEGLSPGQAEDITRVCTAYPELTDDDFVAANLDRWLSDDGAAVPLQAAE
ncbi:MAG: dihydrodipicolinate synthase family protein [Hyphomicrobiales bacterium]|nr:dihydrodipicolinate synthase family protein [Hyphomicrobiales bacterium]MCP5374334.1 dihydrodipicolinate synthase family protein [Hyphomicrobiales bacterium]